MIFITTNFTSSSLSSSCSTSSLLLLAYITISSLSPSNRYQSHHYHHIVIATTITITSLSQPPSHRYHHHHYHHIGNLKQARTATAVNKQLNFTVKNKPHTINFTTRLSRFSLFFWGFYPMKKPLKLAAAFESSRGK